MLKYHTCILSQDAKPLLLKCILNSLKLNYTRVKKTNVYFQKAILNQFYNL